MSFLYCFEQFLFVVRVCFSISLSERFVPTHNNTAAFIDNPLQYFFFASTAASSARRVLFWLSSAFRARPKTGFDRCLSSAFFAMGRRGSPVPRDCNSDLLFNVVHYVVHVLVPALWRVAFPRVRLLLTLVALLVLAFPCLAASLVIVLLPASRICGIGFWFFQLSRCLL